MPGSTSRGVPYPLPTDNRGAYPTEVGQPLAQWINDNTRRVQAGTHQGGTSSIGPDGTYVNSVTFPAAFEAVPTVVISSDNSRMACEAKNVTQTGFSLAARNVSAASTSGAVLYSWIAVAL